MNNTPTTNARWERLCCSGQSWYQIAEEMKLDCRQLERELTAAREELVETRKDFMCLAELLDGHDATECRMNLVRLKEQRDRLAVALQSIKNWIADEALQSLNQDHTVDANDMIAVVKGGADEPQG
jgi:hypothetical protein